jgi:hypothetical protein
MWELITRADFSYIKSAEIAGVDADLYRVAHHGICFKV